MGPPLYQRLERSREVECLKTMIFYLSYFSFIPKQNNIYCVPSDYKSVFICEENLDNIEKPQKENQNDSEAGPQRSQLFPLYSTHIVS